MLDQNPERVTLIEELLQPPSHCTKQQPFILLKVLVGCCRKFFGNHDDGSSHSSTSGESVIGVTSSMTFAAAMRQRHPGVAAVLPVCGIASYLVGGLSHGAFNALHWLPNSLTSTSWYELHRPDHMGACTAIWVPKVFKIDHYQICLNYSMHAGAVHRANPTLVIATGALTRAPNLQHETKQDL